MIFLKTKQETMKIDLYKIKKYKSYLKKCKLLKFKQLNQVLTS